MRNDVLKMSLTGTVKTKPVNGRFEFSNVRDGYELTLYVYTKPDTSVWNQVEALECGDRILLIDTGLFVRNGETRITLNEKSEIGYLIEKRGNDLGQIDLESYIG